MESAPDTPEQAGPQRAPDADAIEDAIGSVDPSDRASEIQRENERRMKEGGPEERQDAQMQFKRQKALEKTFSLVNKMAAKIAPELEHTQNEIDNLSILWAEVLEEVPDRRIQEWLERLPLLSAVAYTAVTTGPKAWEAYHSRIVNSTPDSLEEPQNDHANNER